MLKSPMLIVACSFALGICLGRSGAAAASDVLWRIPLFLSGAAVCLAAALALVRAGSARQSTPADASVCRTQPGAILACGLSLSGWLLAGTAASRLFLFRFPPAHISQLSSSDLDSSRSRLLTGCLTSDPLASGPGVQFDLDLSALERRGQLSPAAGKVRLWLDAAGAQRGALSQLQAGERMRLKARLRRPRSYLNPGSFDFRQRLAVIEDVYWEGTVEPGSAEALVRPVRWELTHPFRGARRALSASIDRLYPFWSPDWRDAAVLKAVLLGDRSALDSETVEGFRRSGLYHLLVIAGLHVGLLAALAAALLKLIGLPRTWRSLLLLAMLACYAGLVEQRAPTLRATLMIGAWLLAGWLELGHSPLNGIGLAALALLAARPAWLFESGFQLSFAAALLIAGLAAPILQRTVDPYRRALRNLESVDLDASLPPRVAQFRLDLRSATAALEKRSPLLARHPSAAHLLLTVPLAAVLWAAGLLLFSAVLQLGLMLPMVETFHRVTLAGVGLNALAIPVMTVLLAVSVPTVLAGTFAPHAAVGLGKPLGWMTSALVALARAPRLPGWLSYRAPAPPVWVAWAFALSIVVLAMALGRSRRVAFASFGAGGLALVLIMGHPFAPNLAGGFLEATQLDCGGGDALFLVLPDRTTVLVGAGGGAGSVGRNRGGLLVRSWDPGESIVSPYLWSRGLKRVDILVGVSLGGERAAGMASVLDNFRVGELWLPDSLSEQGGRGIGPDARAALTEADRQNVRIRWLKGGDSFTRGSASLAILWPPRSGNDSDAESGGQPLVMRVSSGTHSVLVTGDARDSVERALVAQSGGQLASTVLQVPREGAKSAIDPDFLARVSPQFALISVERGNARGLPNRDTLETLKSPDSRILRTDQAGSITIRMSGSGTEVETYHDASAVP